MSALTTAAAPLLAPALAMGTNPNATANALLSVYTANTSGVGTNGGGAIALGMNYGSPATGLFGGAGDKVILYHGAASVYPYSIGMDTGKIYFSVPTGSSYGWFIGGTARMTLDSSGNVGIGAVNPGYSLDVAGVTRSAGVINTVPAHYIGYTSSNPTVYQANGTNNTNGSFYTNTYNYIAFPTNSQTPAGFITAVGGKYTLAYSGIYTITFTTGAAATNTQPLETFITKNGYNSTDLNVPGTVTLASSYHPANTSQWCFSWTGYLSSSEFFCVGFFTSATSGSLGVRTTLSVALVNRTG
jgi:hypothetical protein